MPRKRTYCARMPGHKSECRTADALRDCRQRKTGRRRGVPLEKRRADRARWFKAYKFRRLGISEEQFNQMLEEQGYACAICRVPFDGRRICTDHDHMCCPKQNTVAKTCGRCIRGLLCVRCNTRLEWVMAFGDAVSAYLKR